MEYSQDNTMTRKEYLKSKKKNKFDFSKLKYILLCIVVILLGIYVFKQLKVYNNVTQIANKVVEETKLARTMTMYYVSDSYTKDGDKSVMLYKASDESRTKIPGTENFSKIVVFGNNVYGLVNKTLYSVDLTNYNKVKVVEGLDKKVEQYDIKEDVVYIRTTSGIYKYGIESKELKQIIKGKSYQMKVTEDNIYIIAAGKTSKSIIRYNLGGSNKTQLSGTYIVSSMYILENNIYFINSKDSRIYSIAKSGEIKKITNNKAKENSVIRYKDNIYYINRSDNNMLYSINLKTGKEEHIVKKNVESVQIDTNIIYYKLANDLGIYKYDIDTGKTAQVTSIRSSEYMCMN